MYKLLLILFKYYNKQCSEYSHKVKNCFNEFFKET